MIYSAIGIFSRFMADDFCSINDARRFKMLRYIWHWYNTWGGRYSAVSADELVVYIGPGGVRFVPLVVLFLWVLAATLIWYLVFQKNNLKGVTVALSASMGIIMVFALISSSPNIQTILYWWNGMRTYTIPVIFNTFHLAYIYWAAGRFNVRKHVFWAGLFSFSLALFNGGFNETFTLVQLIFFGVLTGICLITKKYRIADMPFDIIFPALLGAALAMMIMAASPGAARRQTFFPPPSGFLFDDKNYS
jgi:hypothetical protein